MDERSRTGEPFESSNSEAPALDTTNWVEGLVGYSPVAPTSSAQRGGAPVSGSRLSSYNKRKRPAAEPSKGAFKGDVPRPQHASVYFGVTSRRAAHTAAGSEDTLPMGCAELGSSERWG